MSMSHTSHPWLSHVTHMVESYHNYEWVMSRYLPSRPRMSHVTRVNESRDTYEWVMSRMCHANESGTARIWMYRDVTHSCLSHGSFIWSAQFWTSQLPTNESCHTYEWVVSHIWMSHVTHMNGLCHAYELGATQIWKWCVTRANWAVWQTLMSDVTHI